MLKLIDKLFDYYLESENFQNIIQYGLFIFIFILSIVAGLICLIYLAFTEFIAFLILLIALVFCIFILIYYCYLVDRFEQRKKIYLKKQKQKKQKVGE